MPTFKNIGDQHETEAPLASIEVEVDSDNLLPVGRHTFSLQVVDNAGNVSDPATVTVVVRDSVNPTAVITAVPTQVEFGKGFMLDGRQSSDVAPGTIVKYIWTRAD